MWILRGNSGGENGWIDHWRCWQQKSCFLNKCKQLKVCDLSTNLKIRLYLFYNLGFYFYV